MNKASKTWFAVSALILTMTSNLGFAQSSFDTQQQQDIQQLVRDYILKNPEILMEASKILQEKELAAAQTKAQNAIQANHDQIFVDSMTVDGNAKGNVTIVEFFDYQCHHCKVMAPILKDLVKNNGNLRVVYKEFPIFGETSNIGSKAALAASMQGKYMAMHEALLKQDKPLNEKIINDIAQSIGLNMAKFKQDMNSKAVQDALANNRVLAEKLGIQGTPAFIVAATPDGQFKPGTNAYFGPGRMTKEALQEEIKKAGN